MIKCPVCGKYEFERDSDYSYCDVCKWQNDGLQLDNPDDGDGANRISLSHYREYWKKHGTHPPKNYSPQPAAPKMEIVQAI